MRRLSLLALLLACCPPLRAAAPPDPLRQAIRRGLDRLEQGASGYTTRRQCFSCHHQAVTVAAFVAAKKRGLRVPDKVLAEQVEFTVESFRDRLASARKGTGIGG